MIIVQTTSTQLTTAAEEEAATEVECVKIGIMVPGKFPQARLVPKGKTFQELCSSVSVNINTSDLFFGPNRIQPTDLIQTAGMLFVSPRGTQG